MAEAVFRDNPEASRYEYLEDGELVASAEYAAGADQVTLVRIYTRPTHRGQGLAARITEYAVDEIAASGRKIVPRCSYAGVWFEHHPERQDLLA